MRVKEEIKLEIDNNVIRHKDKSLPKIEVIVYHDGIKPYDDWKQESKDDLKDWVKTNLSNGVYKDFLPFANFEASVSYNLT